MTHTIESILKQLKEQHADARVHVFELAVRAQEGSRLELSGRVLDPDTRSAVRRAFQESLPELSLDDSAVQVLRKDNPLILSVATNLTGLYGETSFHSELVSELLYGWPLEVLEERDDWVYVRQVDGYLGWAYRPYLSEQAAPEPTHLVTAPVSRLLTAPEAGSEVLTRVLSGTSLALVSVRQGWAEVIANQRGWLPLEHLRGLDALPQGAQARRAAMAADGRRMMGVPYLWGGCTANGIDCSGLAQLLHRWVGVTIPRDADMQYRAGTVVEPPFEPGDLVFYGEAGEKRRITHVSISLGGWTVLHSSRSRNGVYVDDVQAVDHLRESYCGACSYFC